MNKIIEVIALHLLGSISRFKIMWITLHIYLLKLVNIVKVDIIQK